MHAVHSPGEGPFSGPVCLTTIEDCSHQAITWAEHYRLLASKRNDGNIKVVSPQIGLHPLGRAYSDILPMTKLEQKEIPQKLKAAFEMNPMFIQSHPVSDIITQQISNHVSLIRQEEVQNDPTQKNSSMEYTHDVVSLKEKHLLHLPNGFQPRLIKSKTQLLELASTFKNSGHLC
jgi:hypothetical protein